MADLTADRLSHGKELLMHSSRWFVSMLSAFSLIAGLSAASIAAFLVHLRWDLAILVGMGAAIVAVFEGSWQLSCREKDALDPHWREKARAAKRA